MQVERWRVICLKCVYEEERVIEMPPVSQMRRRQNTIKRLLTGWSCIVCGYQRWCLQKGGLM